MASLFAIDFGLNIGLNLPVLISAFAPLKEHPVVRIGIGTGALDATEDARTGGRLPAISLYDAHGVLFAHQIGGEYSKAGADKRVEIGSTMFGSGTDYTQTPHYMRMVADSTDAICITYVAVTAANGDHRTWHAGYAQQCGAPWYPSPEVFPTTNETPGCIWLSKDDRFLQGISFKLTDFAFITSDQANSMRVQYEEHRGTLCDAPARMAFWEEAWVDDCVPYYPFVVEDFKDKDTFWDTDFQRIMTGHRVPCELRGKLWNQDIDWGKDTIGGEVGFVDSTEAGQNWDAPPVGDGGFGGQDGSVPIESAGQVPSKSTQTALVATQPQETSNPSTQPPATNAGSQTQDLQSAPSQPAQSIEPAGGIANTGDQGAKIISYNPGGPPRPTSDTSVVPRSTAPPGSSGGPARRQQPDQKQKQSHRHAVAEGARTVLARRDSLRQKRDHCVDRLVVSHRAQHSARRVCESATSWGPDFVSVAERLYCDMCERQLWSLCEDGDATSLYCFDLQRREVRLPRTVGRDGLGELPDMRKDFDLVTEWS